MLSKDPKPGRASTKNNSLKGWKGFPELEQSKKQENRFDAKKNCTKNKKKRWNGHLGLKNTELEWNGHSGTEYSVHEPRPMGWKDFLGLEQSEKMGWKGHPGATAIVDSEILKSGGKATCSPEISNLGWNGHLGARQLVTENNPGKWKRPLGGRRTMRRK